MRPYDQDGKMDEAISEVLRLHSEIDSSNIQFEIHEDQVILLGTVPEAEMRKTAENLVSEMPRVRAVWNLLTVKRNETIFP